MLSYRPAGQREQDGTLTVTSCFPTLCLPPSLPARFRADEENESSSSDDEDDDRRRLNDELLGKVCSIEAEEDPVCWYLALVRCHQVSTVFVEFVGVRVVIHYFLITKMFPFGRDESSSSRLLCNISWWMRGSKCGSRDPLA